MFKGWSEKAPKKGSERTVLHHACGDRAFLLPEELKFPIVAKCEGDVCKCEPDCSGLHAAYVRARQWKYDKVADEAQRLLETKCNYSTVRSQK